MCEIIHLIDNRHSLISVENVLLFPLREQRHAMSANNYERLARAACFPL
jgi:hypothetical protein